MRLQLHASAYGLAQFKHAEHALMLPAGFPYEALSNRDAWCHIGIKFKPGDIVHVRDEPGTFYARLYVRAADRLWVDAFEIERVSLVSKAILDATPKDGLAVKWRGPKGKWAVVREIDNEALKGGFQSADEAAAWMTDHTTKVAA